VPKDAKYHQGKFHPRNPKKYMGDTKNIIYRSSWELTFLQYCDRNENITKYASEEFSIPYISPVDGRPHRYYPDFLIEVKEKSGKLKKYVIEIKPKKQTLPPVKKKRVTKGFITEAKTYAVNQAKWKAAVDFCKDNLIEFKIITEDELYHWKK
tara:strand:+ start:343 stop:801 length:459 start_codon:yes stop_codon:yes gene_type:complete